MKLFAPQSERVDYQTLAGEGFFRLCCLPAGHVFLGPLFARVLSKSVPLQSRNSEGTKSKTSSETIFFRKGSSDFQTQNFVRLEGCAAAGGWWSHDREQMLEKARSPAWFLYIVYCMFCFVFVFLNPSGFIVNACFTLGEHLEASPW